MATSLVTRSSDNVWLIGHPTDVLLGARLPSGRDVLQNFVYYHITKKMTVTDSAHEVYNQLVPFWEKSHLPVRQKHHVVQKIKDLYNERNNLMKHRSRSNQSDLHKQKQFTEKLEQLFDISHANAKAIITNEEDRTFLQLQQESRTGSIGPIDKTLADKEKRRAARQQRQQELKRREAKRGAAAAAYLTSQQSTDQSSSDSTEEIESETELYTPQSANSNTGNTTSTEKRRQVVSANILAVLDRTNTSIRKSAMITASVVNEVGCSTSSGVLSKSTIHRRRQLFRETAAKKIKTDFQSSKSIVHWDGKLLPDIGGDDTSLVDRLAILITSGADGSVKLLGVPKITEGTGNAAAKSVLDHMEMWNCADNVIGMCFDTTSCNTGCKQGACTLLENMLGRKLLWLACRHHMFEVLLSDVFKVCLGPSTGPDVLFFKRFRDKWSQLNNRELQVHEVPLIEAPDSLRQFIQDQITQQHPRDDYLELLQLAAFAVGLPSQTAVRRPGAMHRARWMAKAIYSLKIELLFSSNQSVLQLTARELTGVKRFNRFVVLIYLQSWFTSRTASDAPINDLLLIQRLQNYDDENLRNVGLRMMERHSWYLTPELATLALFSDLASPDEKAHLVATMQSERGLHVSKQVPRDMSQLVVSTTFFDVTGLDSSFLDYSSESWPVIPSYQEALTFVRNIPCVNDSAERGVALVQQFNGSVKNEDQRQFLLQVVENHRSKFKTSDRRDLVNI